MTTAYYSRPLHGESIYLLIQEIAIDYAKPYSRPLHGESIYLLLRSWSKQRMKKLFSSPPRGIYISTLSLLSRKDTGLIIQFAVQTRKPDNFH